jgi:two-component system sensor histidine kinase ChvG
VVEHALDRLDGLVASARELDEAAADLIDEPLVPVDLGRVIGKMIQTRSAILDSRDVTIVLASRDLTITADLLPGLYVLGSEAMIETVLDNLIDNAVSFSSSGGEILVHLTHDGSFADLTVSDRGPGVREQQLERIFERYYSERRADGQDEAADEAAPTYFGIGLWIARRNVEAMGGTISAENRSPQGLRVHIQLPLAPGRG